MGETIETKKLYGRLQSAYLEKDREKFLTAIRDLYCVLTNCREIPQEIDEVLRLQLDPASEHFAGNGFLDDPHKLDLEIPLEEGGDPRIIMYKKGDSIELFLKGENISPDIERRFKQLEL